VHPHFFKPFRGLIHGDLALLEELQHLVVVGHRDHFYQLQLLDDLVQPVLDRGVADPESLLHVLDGAVAANELAHEHLVFVLEAGERGQLEFPLMVMSLPRSLTAVTTNGRSPVTSLSSFH